MRDLLSVQMSRFLRQSLDSYRGREFNILRRPHHQPSACQCPAAVPWEIVFPHRRCAEMNHGQPLEVLHSSGGLTPVELYYVLHDESVPLVGKPVSDEAALRFICRVTEAFFESRR